MAYIYILQSEKDCRFYIGSSLDISERLKRHNCGMVTATRNRRPLKLVYFKEYNSITEAKQQEYYIKKQKSRKFIEKLVKDFDASLAQLVEHPDFNRGGSELEL